MVLGRVGWEERVVFGVVMALMNGTPAFDVFNQQIDPVFWGVEGPSDAAALFQQWVYGAWGATLAGLGIFIVFTVQFPFRRQETWARDCLVLGLVEKGLGEGQPD
jgi:hypothetical protein